MTSKTIFRIGLGSAAVALAATATASVAIASPTSQLRSAAASHHVTFAIGGNPEHPIVIANGAITDSGKDDVKHNQFDVLRFAGGTFRIEHPNKDATFVPTIDKKTCYVTFKEHGKFSIDHGTGKYAGVTGSGTFHATGYSIAKQAKSGKCELDKKPVSEIFTVNASGAVS